jgi:SAM-dependent methyltransferase
MDQMKSAGQSDVSVETNATYFLRHLEEYETSVSRIDTYVTIRQFISERIAGVHEMLDVGNGGVFDYDTTKVERITAIDLFLGDLSTELVEKYFPKNVLPRAGSALELPAPNGKFDMVLMVMLLHHLTGTDWRISWNNVEKALEEAWRVLKPGGRLLIVESCVPEWFFVIEKPAHWIVSRLFNSVLSHPITFQFPVRMIGDALGKKAQSVEVISIPKGKHVLQFGVRVPSFLTPVHVYAIEAKKV